MSEKDDEIVYYGDPQIASKNAPIPRWLMFSHIFWIFWGIVWLWLYWNGSWGWLDRGYWGELQAVANTRNPVTNFNEPPGVSPR